MEEGGRRICRGTFAQKELQGHFKAQEGLTPALLAGKAERGGYEQGLQMALGSGGPALGSQPVRKRVLSPVARN